MTSHDFRSSGLAYLISTSDELSNIGSKASLVFFGISASIFLDCSYSLVTLLWPQKRQEDDDDLDHRPPVRHLINTRQKRLQLSSLCLLFILGVTVISIDIWTSSRAAVARAMGLAVSLGGDQSREAMRMSVSITGEAAFWLSTWVGSGFMIHRAHIVYEGNPWLWKFFVLPSLLYLASIVTGILSLAKSSSAQSQRRTPLFALTCLALAATLNSILTVSICLKLYRYRRGALAQIPKASKVRSPLRVVWNTAYDTTAVLVESSALGTISSIVFLGMFASGRESARVMFPILGQTQVLSPMLIGYHICKDTAWRMREPSVGGVHEARLPTQTGSIILDTYHTGPVSLGSFDIDSRHDASRVYSINVVTRNTN